MWQWIKTLWGDKGGCITQATVPRTLSPVEPTVVCQPFVIADGPSTPAPQPPQDHDRRGVQDQTGSCSSSASPTPLEAAVPSVKRYMYSDGKPVGIANTVTKYQEHRPLKPHLTPFEARVEAKMAEEEVVRAAVMTASDDINGIESSEVKQRLAFHVDPARCSSSRA